MKHKQGFILLTILLMIMLLSLLILTQGQLFFMQFKAFNRLKEKSQNFYYKEAAISHIMHNTTCVVNEQKSALTLKSLQNNQCTFTYKQKHYSYLIENLGDYPCIATLLNNQVYSTRHKRISLTDIARPSIIQLRIAEPINQLPCDLPVTTYIKPGILSWREVDSQHFISD